jgi:tRNA pseudouridine32 synthase/23S rRNA pseudouridine746 synthase
LRPILIFRDTEMGTQTTHNTDLFTPFTSDISEIELAEKFTFPFCYEAHPLSILAAEELQQKLNVKSNWQHNFGLSEDVENSPIGKMFGVLVVQNEAGELGYLSAYSGKLTNMARPAGFVPSVFEMPASPNFFTEGSDEITALTNKIAALHTHADFSAAKEILEQTKSSAEQELAELREMLKTSKTERKTRREAARIEMPEDDFKNFEAELASESLKRQHYVGHRKRFWQAEIEKCEKAVLPFTEQLNAFQEKRAKISADLQQQLFKAYQFLNAEGEIKSLLDIFTRDQPPAGAGECAAPKLMNYAFANNLKPICMAEFWWGQSPSSEIRTHGHFYPACKTKCQPILGHMLSKTDVEENPLLTNYGEGKQIETLFEDDYLCVINKPEGLLSVPGKEILDSVATRMKAKYPDATGPMVVHRLDQDTSGIMLIAKTLEIHKDLQSQFIKRSIKKRYVALLDGDKTPDSGIIDLPLRVDLDNRPYQVICYTHGKRAITRYKVIERKNGETRMQLSPVTGRSHQLRVHMAHNLGLKTPIKGDTLYGTKSTRLHLHADFIEFTHPITGVVKRISCGAEF